MAHLAHYKEAHPFPMAVTHWINLICMILLIITGLLIHFPFIAGLTGMARGLHIFCGFLIFLNCIVRYILAFLVQSAPTGGTRNLVRDYKTWLPQKDNRHQGASWIKYYLFMKKDHPLSAKLGVPQKISYFCVGILIIIMFITGLSLWEVTAPAFSGLVSLVGGMMSMRIIHYFMMFVFICFTLLHMYLVFIEGPENANLMLLRKEHGGLVYDPERHVIVGEDHSVDHH